MRSEAKGMCPGSIQSRDSIERRILEYVRDHYPVTVDELAKGLHVPSRRVDIALKGMAREGMVELDILPDKTFVRLLVIPARKAGDGKEDDPKPRKGGFRAKFRFPGRKERERRKDEKRKEEERDYSYG